MTESQIVHMPMFRELTDKERQVLDYIAQHPRDGRSPDQIEQHFARSQRPFPTAQPMEDLMSSFKFVVPMTDGQGGSSGRYCITTEGREYLQRLNLGQAHTISDTQAIHQTLRQHAGAPAPEEDGPGGADASAVQEQGTRIVALEKRLDSLTDQISNLIKVLTPATPPQAQAEQGDAQDKPVSKSGKVKPPTAGNAGQKG